MHWEKGLSWLHQHGKKLALWGGGTVAVLLLFIVLVLPGVIRSQAEKGIAAALNRKVSIAKVRINPFGMTATVEGFRLFEADGVTPFVALGHLKVSLSMASIYRFGIVADRLSIGKPTVRLVRTAVNRYNFSDILDHLAKQPKSNNSGTPRFSINNISISDGDFIFDDRAVAGGKKHTVRNLTLAIPFISNIPHLAEKYTDPHFSAVVNGAPLRFEGKAKPLAKSMETSINLKLDRLNLPYYLAYLPADLPIKLDKGSLTLDLVLTYRIHASQKPELTISGLTQLDNLQLSEKNGTPLAGLKRFDLQAKAIEVFSRLVDLERISLNDLIVHAARDEQGKLNFQRLLPPEQSNEKTKPKKDEQAGPPLKLKVTKANLTNATINFSDRQPKGGFKASLSEINLKLANISTEKDDKSKYELSLKGDGGERINASGTAAITPLAATTTFSLNDIKLQRGWPYLQALLTKPVKGTLGVNGAAEFTATEGLNAHDVTVILQDLAAEFGAKDGARLSRLEVTGIGFNQKQNRAEVGAVRLDKGSVSISREEDGTVSPQALLVKQPKSVAASPAPPIKPVKRSTTKDEPKPFSYLVKQINVSGLNVSFKDNSFQEPPVFNLRNIRLATGNLSGPTFTPMPLKFDATYGGNAPFKAVGTLTPQPFRYKGSVNFSRLPIGDFEVYLPENVNVSFVDGTLDSSLRLDVGLDKANKPYGSFSGGAGIRRLHTVDTVLEEDLLKWESLQLDQIKGTIAPLTLSIHQIALNDVYSRIAVRKDRTLNLQNLVTKPKAAEPVAGVPAQQPATLPVSSAQAKAAPAAATAPPQIRINEVTIQDGTIAFSDVHLPQQFKTTFHKLGGRVTGLSSEMNQFADVDLRGNLENHSPLLIKGRINPLRDDLFVDLTISFKDIELSPASPYSGTYLGYVIDKGKLFLDLTYHIENKQLKAENKVFVDQFTFGRAVASDKATSLPIRLGVALLKDRNGEIHLDLPVTGRTDDPQFSIWGVVWQVVKNLFVKAATSPFALLSSMMGSSEDLSTIYFPFGSSELPPAEQQKLLTLAKGLNDRPGLKVEIKGYVDRERDAEGYRTELLTKKMKQEKYLELSKSGKGGEGLSAAQMIIQPNEYSHYLKLVYQKEKFPKPRNFIGMLKDLPDAEMKKLIIANTTVGNQELSQLAAERVASVRSFLISSGNMAQERLFQKGDDMYKPSSKEKGVASRAELNPIAP